MIKNLVEAKQEDALPMKNGMGRRDFVGLLFGLGAGLPFVDQILSKVKKVVEPQPKPVIPAVAESPAKPAYIGAWAKATRHEVRSSHDPLLSELLRAARRQERLELYYYGGSFHGMARPITPESLFTVEGYAGTYLQGWCHVRGETRTFRTDRLQLEPMRLEAVYPLHSSSS